MSVKSTLSFQSFFLKEIKTFILQGFKKCIIKRDQTEVCVPGAVVA